MVIHRTGFWTSSGGGAGNVLLDRTVSQKDHFSCEHAIVPRVMPGPVRASSFLETKGPYRASACFFIVAKFVNRQALTIFGILKRFTVCLHGIKGVTSSLQDVNLVFPQIMTEYGPASLIARSQVTEFPVQFTRCQKRPNVQERRYSEE